MKNMKNTFLMFWSFESDEDLNIGSVSTISTKLWVINTFSTNNSIVQPKPDEYKMFPFA